MNDKNIMYRDSITLEIKTYEIDIAGHVNNIVYIKWLEDLRLKLFEQFLSVNNLLAQNLYPVITSTNITYKKQLKFGDKPTGFIWVDGIKHNFMTLKFKFIVNEDVSVLAEQKCIIMNLVNGKMDKKILSAFLTESVVI